LAVKTKVVAFGISQADAATLFSGTSTSFNVVTPEIAIGKPSDATFIAVPMVSS
jgi:hypothetical protein